MSTPSVYRGRSIEELIPKIEAELGPDAIVLRRRTGLTGGIGGFFQRPFAEVEAQAGHPRVDVYDESPHEPAMPAPLERSGEPQPESPFEQGQPAPIGRPVGAYVSDSLAALAGSGPDAPPAHPQGPEALSTQAAHPFAGIAAPFTPQPVESFTTVLAAAEHTLGATATTEEPEPAHFPTITPAVHSFEEFEPLQAELRRIDPPTPPTFAAPTNSGAPAAPAPPSTAPASPPPPSPLRGRARTNIELGLVELGVSERFARELVDHAEAHVQPFAPRTSLLRAVHRGLTRSIPVGAPLPATGASIALVGPGGSGKTSCCAALLTAYRKRSTLAASCATILAEEREELALLLSPHLMTPTALGSAAARRALAGARASGILLLDTPPLSPADRPAIRSLASALGELSPDRIVLALPATLGARAAAQLLEALAPLGASAVAITHADETDQLGVAVEAACKAGMAPEYILDRPRARGRLTRVDPVELADRLLPGAL